MEKKTQGLASALCLFLIACQPEVDYPKEAPKVGAQDCFAIAGEWVGTLTYTDYSSGKPIEIAANVNVTRVSDNRIEYTISYPDEPWEDSESTTTISNDGRLLDGQVVAERTTVGDGTLIVTTRYRGEDDNRIDSAGGVHI